MKKFVYFLLVSLFVFTSCKKDASNPVNADTVPSVPTLSTPKDTSSNIAVPVVLTWNESSGAKSYTLQVSASSSFSSFVLNKSDITTTTQQVPDLNYLAVYYWRVSATNSAGTSDWSKLWSFTTTGEAAFVPQLSLPANGAVDQKLFPVLTWNQVSNASSYTLQISTNSSFTSFVFNSDTLTAITKQINDLSGSTKYYWRVSAVNNFGTKGWSETWSFTTGIAPIPPVLLSPTDGAIDVSLSPTLSWNASNGATSYTLQLSTSNSFSSFVYNQSSTTTSKQITGLTNSTKYYWRARTNNIYGSSNPSVVWNFTTGALPEVPILSSPQNGATDIPLSPTLIWNPSNKATSYILQVSANNSFSNFVFNDTIGNTTNKQVVGLDGVTKYYWRILATNSFGKSNPSVVWDFTTTTNGTPCPGTPTLTYQGKTYKTVQIGIQCWLRENLDVGTMIQGTPNQSNNNVIEKYCYGNNTANCTTYGGLYQWNEAMQYVTTEKAKGICPTGWHIPTKAELETLMATVGNDGNKLKSEGQGTGSGEGTNTSGFSALLAGIRGDNGTFLNLGISTVFWSSTEGYAEYAYTMYLLYEGSDMNVVGHLKEYGFSIRCLKN